MQTAYDQFIENITRVKQLGQLYSALKIQTTSALDLDDLLRAELVLTVSALDYFIHEIVRIGIIQSFERNRSQTKSFLFFQCGLNSVIAFSQNPKSIDWLDNEIRIHHGWKSFEHPDNIAQAISLISDEKLWDRVGQSLSDSPANIKEKLRLIVDRRNKIAHEADIDPTNPPSRWPIDEQMVNETIEFVENVVKVIFNIVK
jgi:hypothetical protein